MRCSANVKGPKKAKSLLFADGYRTVNLVNRVNLVYCWFTEFTEFTAETLSGEKYTENGR